ncbi:MAG: nitroreductase family protein [Isosphaeraceae bacterium]|nr:nitroreductase family protein [Isosphaeraceae bacterium]
MGSAEVASAVEALVQKRRSIRDYVQEPIGRDLILEVLSLAGRAPSAWNLQPWRFVAVTDAAHRETLQAAAFGQNQVGRAPVTVVVYSDMVDTLARIDSVLRADLAPEAKAKTRQSIIGFFETLTDSQRDQWGRAQANIALGYLLLILEAYGLGSSPMLGFDAVQVRSLFGLPDHAEVVALVAFGRPAEEGRASQRHEVASLVRWA